MHQIGLTLYLEFTDLNGWGVPDDTLKSGCKRHRAGKARSWANIPDPLDGRRVLIAYDTIPPATRAKLPTKAELLQQLKDEQTQLRAMELDVAGTALVGLHTKAEPAPLQ